MGNFSLSFNIGGLQEDEEGQQVVERDVVIIGAGPAGFTAGLYAARAELHPVILVGQAFGGQAATTSELENYPGFPEGIGGMELAERMANQATRFGAEIVYEEVTKVDFQTYPFVLETYGATYKAKAVIICTGTSPRKLGVPGEEKFIGRGVSFCATCDGYFYKDKTVVVVGGGDSAIDEGLYLTRFADKVIVIHRRDKLRAGPILQKRAFANEKMSFVWDTVVDEVLGEDFVTGVKVHNVKTGKEDVIPCDGVFVYVGLIPNTKLFEGQLELDENGYIITDKRQRTSIPGVYAAGDVQDPWFRQVVIAAGAGAAAAIDAERFLAEKAFEAAAQEEEKEAS
ncbi:MAG: thioredoxin-disulfide reductase [Anaerolineae bacterium]|nr:thioredoxin-disulfide reductase [Anaerolineae bacterium]